jgi:hypothetical protein
LQIQKAFSPPTQRQDSHNNKAIDKAYKKGAQDNLRKVAAAYQTESELSLLTTKDKKDTQQLLSSLHA